MDPFMTALFGAKEIKATARVKMGEQTRTVTLGSVVPASMDDADWVSAAAEGGVSLNVREGTGDKSKNLTGKGVYGAAARSAMAFTLGVKTDVPEVVKRRGKPVTPSTNGTHADATTGS